MDDDQVIAEKEAAWRIDPDWRHVPGMWSKLRDGPYQRVSTGIGDAINLSGAAIYLARRDGRLTWHAFAGSEKSVMSIFALNPEVEVVTIPDWAINPFANTVTCHTLIFSDEIVIPKKSKLDMFDHIYTAHGVPYSVRWDMCPVKEAAKLVPQDPLPDEENYCFVHESPKYGYRIDRSRLPKDLPLYGPEQGLNLSILAYVDTLKAATEIHVVDSAFFHLTESIETCAKLFWHRYSREYIPGWNSYKTRHNWTVFS